MQSIVKFIGRDADVDHSQIIGGMQSNYWGGYIPRIPPDFSTPGYNNLLFSLFMLYYVGLYSC